MGQKGKSPPRFKVLALRRSGLFHYPLCAYTPQGYEPYRIL